MRQAIPLRSEDEGQPPGRVGGQLVEAHRVVGQCERRDREPDALEVGDAPRPRVDASPRHLEDGAHGDADRPAVQRIRAARGDQHRVDAERRGRPEDRPDVGVVDDVLEDQDPSRIGDEGIHGGQHWSLHRGERTPMQVEPGELLDDVVLADEDRDPVGLGRGDEVREVGDPPLGHEVAAGSVPGLQRPPDDLLRLGDVEPSLRLGPPSQRDVGQRDVVGQAVVVGTGDGDGHAEQPRTTPRAR